MVGMGGCDHLEVINYFCGDLDPDVDLGSIYRFP